MSIRRARTGDANCIRSLIFAAVTPHRYVDFDEQGWNTFAKPNEIQAIEMRISSKDYLTLCCEQDQTLVGIITIYQNEQIYQLFVHPDCRRMGIARELWLAARKLMEDGISQKRYWVKSSTLAVPLYQSLGFKLTGDKQTEQGISYYPMELVCSVES